MNLQTRYGLEVAQDELAAKVERDVQPVGNHVKPIKRWQGLRSMAKEILGT